MKHQLQTRCPSIVKNLLISTDIGLRLTSIWNQEIAGDDVQQLFTCQCGLDKWGTQLEALARGEVERLVGEIDQANESVKNTQAELLAAQVKDGISLRPRKEVSMLASQ